MIKFRKDSLIPSVHSELLKIQIGYVEYNYSTLPRTHHNYRMLSLRRTVGCTDGISSPCQ